MARTLNCPLRCGSCLTGPFLVRSGLEHGHCRLASIRVQPAALRDAPMFHNICDGVLIRLLLARQEPAFRAFCLSSLLPLFTALLPMGSGEQRWPFTRAAVPRVSTQVLFFLERSAGAFKCRQLRDLLCMKAFRAGEGECVCESGTGWVGVAKESLQPTASNMGLGCESICVRHLVRFAAFGR